MNPYTVFIKDFDHKLQDPFLNKSEELFLSKVSPRDCLCYPFNL